MNSVTETIKSKSDNIEVSLVKKTKKNQPKVLPAITLVDKEAFESNESKLRDAYIMRSFWESENNKILVARKKDTQAIVGYAIFSVADLKDERFGRNKRIPGVYLLRIGVRFKCQRQGIGKKLMTYLFENYPEHALSLDVNAENTLAIKFYNKCGLRIQKVYHTPEPDNVEFALMETPLDSKGKKADTAAIESCTGLIQAYYQTIEEFYVESSSEEEGEIQTDKN